MDRISSLKLTKKEVNTRFLSNPQEFLNLGINYGKPYVQHKKHINKLIERFLALKQLYGKSMNINNVILNNREWKQFFWKSQPENLSIINDIIKLNTNQKDKFGKKRSFLEPVLQQFSQKIKDVQIEKLTARIFRKLLKEYGFKIVRSNDQYFVYPK